MSHRALSKALVSAARSSSRTTTVRSSCKLAAYVVGPASRSLSSTSKTYATAPTKLYYVVKKGRIPGIYEEWAECSEQVKGYSGAIYQKVASMEAAEAYLKGETLLGPASSPDRLVIYTDGSCTSSGQGGFGAYFAGDATPDISQRVPALITPSNPEGTLSSDKCELYAILRVLEQDPDPKRKLHFYSDSSYVVNTFTIWKQSPSSRQKNSEMITLIDELIANRKNDVTFTWVKGHAAVVGNVDADKLADKGVSLPELEARDLAADLKAYRQMRGVEETLRKSSSKKAPKKKAPKKVKVKDASIAADGSVIPDTATAQTTV